MKKRMTAVALVVAMMMTVAANALSIDADATVTAIPEIYVTFVPEERMDTFDVSAFDYIAVYAGGNHEVSSGSGSRSPVVVKLTDITVAKTADPIINEIKEQMAELNAQGVIVTSGNIVLPYTGRLKGEGNVDICVDGDDDDTDEGVTGDQFYDSTTYWGEYNGQQIRYYDTSLTYRTDIRDVGNVPDTWFDIMSTVISESLSILRSAIGGETMDIISDAVGTISNLITAAANPLNVYYDTNTEYIKAHNAGMTHYRHVVLEDVDDKVSGYDYYPWGSIAQLDYVTVIEANYYTGKDQNNMANYDLAVGTTAKKYLYSENFFNTSELFRIVTDHYNYVGQQFYSEDIEIWDAEFQFVLE